MEVGLDGTPSGCDFDDVGDANGATGTRDGCGPGGEPPRPPTGRKDAVGRRLARGGCDDVPVPPRVRRVRHQHHPLGGRARPGQRAPLVPTRWSITAVDDTLGQYLRGRSTHAESVDGRNYRNEFIGNAFWVILAPGRWEFELIELKAPGSVWNPDPEAGMYLAADREGYEGRTGYVNETAGAYHASRLGVLEHLQERGRQAKALVIRHVSDDYWGPVGVWQIRESIRHAFEGEMADAETFGDAVRDCRPSPSHFSASPARLPSPGCS